MFEIARLLRRAGVSVRGAKKAVDSLLRGEVVDVGARHTDDYDTLKKSLADQNVTIHRIQRREVDVKALRARLGVSQEAFAGRFGLEVATVRNWEQGRTTPEGPAAVLLHLIDRDPDKVLELLVS
jgi:putative transcriptional regulator